jgi:GntR family transcriptional regulator
MDIERSNYEIFDKVLDQVKQDIEKEVLHSNEKLRPTYEMASEYKVSRSIMEAVIDQLEEDNLVIRRVGIGVFVRAKPIYSSGIEELGSVSEMIKRSGKVPGTQYVAAEIVDPTANDRKNFSPLDIQSIAKVERIRTADGEPVVYCIDKVDNDLIPICEIHNQGSIFQLIEQYTGKRIAYANAFIEPIGFHEKISSILNCQPDQPLLLLRQTHYTDDHQPILFSANFFRSDVFHFHVVRKRM